MNQKAVRRNHLPQTKTRILIVDDHPVVRQGLARVIQDAVDLEVCGEAEDVAGALERLDQTQTDFVILDLSMKDATGLAVLKEAQARWPKLPVLVVSMHDDLLYARQALDAGARGYVIKDQAAETVIEAIRQVLAGGIYLSPPLRVRLADRGVGLGALGLGPKPKVHGPMPSLSEREKQVLAELGEGLSTRQIAAKLTLAVKTVETYREHLKTKLGLKSAAELVHYAVRLVAER